MSTKKKVAPAKKKSRQQNKSRARKKSHASKNKVAPPVRKCAPEYDAVRTHLRCCTHTRMALTGLRRVNIYLKRKTPKSLWLLCSVELRAFTKGKKEQLRC